MKTLPVIHHSHKNITFSNVEKISNAGADGLFLISMEGNNEDIPVLSKQIKNEFPHLLVGFNLLGVSAKHAVELSLSLGLDMTWSDNNIVSSSNTALEALEISKLIKNTNHLFFNSVAFKYQSIEKNPPLAAKNSFNLNFIPTTSGDGTGIAANIDKVAQIKEQYKEIPLALASGLTPLNISSYKDYIDYALVATGISDSFHVLNENLIKEFISNAK